MKTKFQIYRALDGEYYWRAKRGSNIIADGRAYNTKAALLKSLTRFIASVRSGQFIIE